MKPRMKSDTYADGFDERLFALKKWLAQDLLQFSLIIMRSSGQEHRLQFTSASQIGPAEWQSTTWDWLGIPPYVMELWLQQLEIEFNTIFFAPEFDLVLRSEDKTIAHVVHEIALVLFTRVSLFVESKLKEIENAEAK